MEEELRVDGYAAPARRVRVARATLFHRIGPGNAIAAGPVRFRSAPHGGRTATRSAPEGDQFLPASHPPSLLRDRYSRPTTRLPVPD